MATTTSCFRTRLRAARACIRRRRSEYRRQSNQVWPQQRGAQDRRLNQLKGGISQFPLGAAAGCEVARGAPRFRDCEQGMDGGSVNISLHGLHDWDADATRHSISASGSTRCATTSRRRSRSGGRHDLKTGGEYSSGTRWDTTGAIAATACPRCNAGRRPTSSSCSRSGTTPRPGTWRRCRRSSSNYRNRRSATSAWTDRRDVFAAWFQDDWAVDEPPDAEPRRPLRPGSRRVGGGRSSSSRGSPGNRPHDAEQHRAAARVCLLS